MAAEDLLNDGERRALTPKVVRKRAEAILSIAQLAEALDLSQEARSELVDKVRTIVNGVDGKMPRKLTEAAKNLIGVLSKVDEHKIPAPLAIEAPAFPLGSVEHAEVLFVPPIEEVPDASDAPLAEEIVAVVLPEANNQHSIKKDDTTGDKALARTRVYLQKIAPGAYEGLTLDHMADIARVIKVLSGVKSEIRANSMPHEAILTGYLNGLSRMVIAEKYGRSAETITLAINYVTKKSKVHPLASHFESFVTRIIAGESVEGMLAEIYQASGARGEFIPEKAQPVVVEAALTPEPEAPTEHTHITLGDALADLLSLDKPSTTSLKEFLNPDITNTNISKYKREALAAIVDYVNRTFDGLDDPRLNLTLPQKAALRQLTGAWYEGKVEGTPISVALMIRKANGHMSRDLVIERIYGALDAVLAQDRKGVGLDEEEAPEQEISTEPQTHEGYLKHAKKQITELVTGLGMKPQKAEVLWQHIHFDEEGKHKEDSPNLRVILQALQQRIARFGASKFEDNPVGAAGMKKLVFTGMGFNTLDTVYGSLVATNPSLTKEECEQLVIDAVIELLQ